MTFPPTNDAVAAGLDPAFGLDLKGLFPLSQNHQKECEQGVSKGKIGC
jgi:hypothetical protein